MVSYFPWVDGNILYADSLNQSLGYASTTYQEKINVGSTLGSVVFSPPLKFAILKNNGDNSVFLNVGSSAAITDSELVTEASTVINGGTNGVSNIYYITSGTNTTDLRVFGTY